MTRRYMRKGIIADINGEVVDVQTKGSAQVLRNVPLLGNPQSLSLGDTVMLQEFSGQLVAMVLSNTPGDGVYSPLTKTVASGGEIAVHAIDGAYHTGSLAHSALSGIGADNHHDKAHPLSGGDHTGDLAFTQLDSLIATPAIVLGTAAAAGSASALIRSDATIAAFDAVNPVTITQDAVGSPGAAALAARRDHVHAITASSAPGAASALLKSTAAGGLTLQSLALSGSLDITDGDLAVLDGATTVFFVDESAHNVGVMTNAPDAQFALDVNGPIRGQYLIGPHAIQLSDAVMICHFDGSYPFETNYDVDTTGHLGQTATVSGGVIGRPGKFGKAVQVAEATTNLHTNPSVEVAITGYAGSYRCACSRSAEQARFGEYSAKFVADATASNFYGALGANIAGAASTAYTVTAWVYAVDGNTGTAKLEITDYHATYTTYVSAFTSGDGWQRLSVTFTTDAAHTHFNIRLRGAASSAPDDTYYVDAVQPEQGGYPTPYCDGSLGDGHSWSGTAHASTSSRTAGNIIFASPFSDSMETFTIAGWVRPCADRLDMGSMSSDNGTCIVNFGNPGTSLRSEIWFKFTTGYLSWYDQSYTTYLSPAIDYDAEDWLWFAATRDGNTITLYVYNYTQDTSGSATNTSTDHSFASTMTVGDHASTTYSLNGLIDDFVVLDRALSAVEVRAIYESNAPVFAETSIQAWRSPGQVPIWVNEEGLWGRDADGNASLGWSSVDGKSWGGQTLGKGDFLLGYSTQYLLWDASAATLTIAGNGSGITSIDGGNIQTGTVTATQIAAATITGTEISATAKIVAGTGNNIGVLDGVDATYRIYAGHATPGSAPFRVTQAGVLTATGAVISGAVTISNPGDIDASTINNDTNWTDDTTANAANAHRVLGVGGTWTPSSHNVLSWTSVTLRLGDGSTVNIVNGGTGFMSFKTYIYYNGTTTLQITTDPANISSTHTLVAVAQNGSVLASVQIVGGGTYISGDWINTGTITATQITGTTLSAIYADLGSVTAGQIVVGDVTNKLWLNDADDGGLAVGGLAKGSAPFRVSAAGALVATSAAITGTITITGGSGIASLTDAGALATADTLDDVPNGATYERVLATDLSAGHIKLTSSAVIDGSWYDESGVEISATAGISIYGTNNAFTTRATKTGTIQCSVNSAGAITAGAGAVKLDSDGILIASSGDANTYLKWTNSDITTYTSAFGFANLQKTDPGSSTYGVLNVGLKHDSNNQAAVSCWLNEVDVVIQKSGNWRYVLQTTYDKVHIESVPLAIGSGTADPTVSLENGMLFYRTDLNVLRLRISGAWHTVNCS